MMIAMLTQISASEIDLATKIVGFATSLVTLLALYKKGEMLVR